MIFITGDTHNSLDFDRLDNFKQRMNLAGNPLTKNDKLIVAGDFGIPWVHIPTLEKIIPDYSKDLSWVQQISNDSMLIKYLEEYPCEVLFVDGNHDNFDVYDELPEEERYGSVVGKLSENIYHLKRGNVYILEGYKVFTFGGAESIDRARRTDKLSWWDREIPSREEYYHGLETLAKNNFEVDFVISHTMPRSMLKQANFDLAMGVDPHKLTDPVGEMLDFYMNKLKFNMWYVGHMHVDSPYYKFQLCYQYFYEMKKQTRYGADYE